MSDFSNRDDDGDDAALVAELRRLDDGPEPPPELWQRMADEVRAGYQRALAETLAQPEAAPISAVERAPDSPAAPVQVQAQPGRRRWRTRTLAAATSGLALAALLALWVRTPPVPSGDARTAHAAEPLDEVTVFGDELGPGDELDEMSAAQLDEIDSAFKKGA
jgi:hypothetical protein